MSNYVIEGKLQSKIELKEDQDEFLDDYRLRNIIKTYSDHISMPIQMPVQQQGEEGQDEEKKGEMETVNQVTALWKRSKNEIKDEEYNQVVRSTVYYKILN